jgi:acid stress chaperone HdeA
VSKRLAAASAAVLCAMAIVSGCSGASNSGGDTTCRDFLALKDNDRDAVVARMLKERNGSNSSTGDVEAKRQAVGEACQPAAKQSAKISDVA